MMSNLNEIINCELTRRQNHRRQNDYASLSGKAEKLEPFRQHGKRRGK